MLFKKYQLVIFKDKHGSCSSLTLPRWLLILGTFMVLAIIGSNIYLWHFFQEHRNLESQLHQAENTVQSQKIQLTTLYHKTQDLEQNLERIQEFDDKLRVMLDLDPPQTSNPNPAGGTPENFSSSSVPFYRQEALAREMHNFLDQLSTESRLEEIRQQEILQALHKQQNRLASTPSIWPAQGWVSSDFGYRASPFTGQREFHKGIDISAPEGTPIYAPADGEIISTRDNSTYGLTMVLDHGRGFSTKYAHMKRFVVDENEEVSRGQLIGYVGNTGRSTGPHLHYEVRINNVPVNPKKYILN